MAIFSALGLIGRRVYTFRNEVGRLWRAFLQPKTPLYLKAAMVGVVLYLISPIDFIPDFIPGFGWLDDLVLIPLAVSWIVSMLPRETSEPKSRDAGLRDGPTIEGTARRR